MANVWIMKMRAHIQRLAARVQTGFPEWTDTDTKACHTTGILVFVLTATIVLPPVLFQIATGGGNFRELWLALVRPTSGPDSGWGNMMAGYVLPAVMVLILVGMLGTLAGVVMLGLGRKFRTSSSTNPLVRRRCAYLLLGPLLFLVGVVVLTLLPIPWRALGVSGRGISQLTEFWLFAPFGFFFLEKFFVIPHAIATLFVGCVNLAVARGMLKPAVGEEPSALAVRLQKLVHPAKVAIQRWVGTDVRAYRVCGMIGYLLAAILVLPIAWFQVTTVLFRGRITTVVDIWQSGGRQTNSFTVIPTLLTLGIVVGAAMLASVVGARMFAKARQVQKQDGSTTQVRLQCKRVLQRFAWLLLVIIPIATVFTFRSGYPNARQINLSRLFETIDFSTWREARATFLWTQFCPLLLLGLVAWAFASACHSNTKPTEQ